MIQAQYSAAKRIRAVLEETDTSLRVFGCFLFVANPEGELAYFGRISEIDYPHYNGARLKVRGNLNA